MKKVEDKQETISVLNIQTGILRACILGTTPLVFNRKSADVLKSLLLPPRKKNRAERESTLKHDPLKEYRASVYSRPGKPVPTRLSFPGSAFKGAIRDAALDMPGATKAEIGRLLSIKEFNVDIYGVPELWMTGVKMAGIVKAPDVRTRAIVRNWACSITLSFVKPMLNEVTVANLIAGAGVIIGIGDNRQQKGAGSNGLFEMVAENDPRFLSVLKNGTGAIQDQALAEPLMFDAETEELFTWFYNELKRRGDEPIKAAKPVKAVKAKNGAHLNA